MKQCVTSVIAGCAMALASSARARSFSGWQDDIWLVNGALTQVVADFLGIRYADHPRAFCPTVPDTLDSADRRHLALAMHVHGQGYH